MWELNTDDIWLCHFSKIGRYWDSKDKIDPTATDPEGKT